jgi:glycosyltransferase involved in cell wall biosynthesis
MTKFPKVSILIPVYNREELVKKAIESAINQTYENIEVIAVDNKSTDRTYEVLKEYAEKYPKMKVYQNEENLGPVRNWKKCLEYSSGEFIKILFSDDWIEETFVEKCMEILLANDDVGFVYTKTYIADSNGKYSYINDIEGKKGREYFVRESINFPQGKTPVSPGCALFRKESIIMESNIPNRLSLNHQNTGAGIDLLIYLNSFKRYKYCYYTSNTTAYFRKHNEAITIMEWDVIWKYYFTALLYYVKKEDMANHICDLKVSILQFLPLKDFVCYKKLLQLYGLEGCSINKKDFILLVIKKMFKSMKDVIRRSYINRYRRDDKS